VGGNSRQELLQLVSSRWHRRRRAAPRWLTGCRPAWVFTRPGAQLGVARATVLGLTTGTRGLNIGGWSLPSSLWRWRFTRSMICR
jgi:hypothetical protein